MAQPVRTLSSHPHPHPPPPYLPHPLFVNQNGYSRCCGCIGADILLSFVTDMRTTLSGMSLSKTIPVGNSDAGSFFSSKVLAAVDYGVRLTLRVYVLLPPLSSTPSRDPKSHLSFQTKTKP